MNRLRLLGPIAALCMLLAFVIAAASPYVPPVGSVREIEEIWEIEDARTESETPLVTALENNGVALAYDALENTFYCTLGLENGKDWPELYLTAPDAPEVNICFVDDYTYDDCCDAIAQGYSYELFAYTQTQYAYFRIVFTGLPIVMINGAQEIGVQDVFCDVAIAQADTFVSCGARVHQRGAGSAAVSEKKSYSVEFARNGGDGDVYVELPAMGSVDDLILISCVLDDTLMRDRLSWNIYASLVDETRSFGARKTEYAEVFVGGTYMGVYLMMEPVNASEEIGKTSARCVVSDSLYRTTVSQYAGERPYIVNPAHPVSAYELHYGAEQENGFIALEPYLELETERDDEVFCEMALLYIDMESALTQYLFVQAAGMSDNVYNNMYIWAHFTPEGLCYRFAPWDMDMTWGRYKDEETGETYQDLFDFDVVQRLIDLDLGGVARQTLLSLWRQMREEMFNVQTVESMVRQYARELNESGAFARNAARWGLENTAADGSSIVSYASEHFLLLDELFSAYDEMTDTQNPAQMKN